MSVTSLIEFDDISEHTFDSTKLTLLSDKGQLLSQVSSNEILFSNFDGNLLPVLPEVSKRGNKTLVFGGVNNTGQIAGGLLDFPNQDKSFATYKNITEIVNDFAFYCKIISNVSVVTADRDLIDLTSNIDGSRVRVYFSNQGGGITRLRSQVFNSSGASVDAAVLLTKDMALDPNWEVTVSNDNAGNILIYVDGILRRTIVSPPLNFTDSDLILGNDVESVSNFDNFQLFKSNQFPNAIAFPFPESTTFVLPAQVMITNLPLIIDEIISIQSIHSIPANTQFKFFITLDGASYWFNGTAWGFSDQTLAQSNTLLEVQTNLSTIPIVKGIGKLLEIGTIFKSDDGYTTPIIENLTVKYKIQFKSSDVTLCSVFGTIRDNAGQNIIGATVRVQSIDKFFNNVFIGPSAKVLTDSQGKFSISLPETATDGTAVDITIEYTEKQLIEGIESDVPVAFEYKNRVIPNLPTAELQSLATL